MTVTDGEIDLRFTFTTTTDGGATMPVDPYEVRLIGTICGDTLTGHLSSDSAYIGDGYDLTLALGADRGFEVTCAP